jgi:hypothetical protein
MSLTAKVIGPPLSPIDDQDVKLVEGTLGLTKAIPYFPLDEKRSEPDVFHLLFAADKKHTGREVAELLLKNYALKVRPFVPWDQARPLDSPAYDLEVLPDQSHQYLQPQVIDRLEFNPNLNHLASRFGENADYYMVALRFKGEDYPKIFNDEDRKGWDREGKPTGFAKHLLKYDILQYKKTDAIMEYSALDAIPDNQPDSLGLAPVALHVGGLAVYSRTNLKGEPDN